MPFLLSLHNRAGAILAPLEARRMRESVLASSFARNWNLVQAVHRSHIHQEVSLSPSSDDHIILVVGKPLRLRLSFHGAPQENTVLNNSAIIIPRGAPTQWQWRLDDREPEQRAELLQLYLKPDSLARVAEEIEIAPDCLSLRETSNATDATLAQICRCLLDEMQRESAGSRLYADSLACALAVHLLRGYRSGNALPSSLRQELTPQSRRELTPRRLRLALDYMEANLHTDIALADIAGAAGISQYHFARLFKNATGQAPHQYLVCQRIERAKRLLKTTDQSVGEIAYALGFGSQSRFTVQFRRWTAMTPSEFRKR